MIVAVVSIVYMFLVQFIPKVMNVLSVVIGALSMIGLAVTVFLYKYSINPVVRYTVFVIIILFFFIMVCVFFKKFKTWGLYGVFLDYSSKFVCARIFPLVIPIIFLALMVAFYFFQLYQYRSFWSFGPLRFDPEHDLYHHIKEPAKNILLSSFQIIQIIWGTVFLK